MKCLLEKKIRGFNFGASKIKDYNNKVGIIKHQLDNSVVVLFDDGNYCDYPLPEALNHIVDDEDNIPELGDGVLMEVSHNEDFFLSLKRKVIGKKHGLFYGQKEVDSISVFGYKYARPIKEKTELSMQEIADKFGVDVNDLKMIVRHKGLDIEVEESDKHISFMYEENNTIYRDKWIKSMGLPECLDRFYDYITLNNK